MTTLTEVGAVAALAALARQGRLIPALVVQSDTVAPEPILRRGGVPVRRADAGGLRGR